MKRSKNIFLLNVLSEDESVVRSKYAQVATNYIHLEPFEQDLGLKVGCEYLFLASKKVKYDAGFE